MEDRPRQPYWRTKTLAEMSPAEWESLCDGCGLCCLIRFEDEDTGEIIPTRVACRLLDDGLCRCKDYANRKAVVPDCVRLTPGNVAKLPWMPKSCGYRRVHEGRDLAWWHPLISGDSESVHRAGVSVRGQTVPEQALEHEQDALDFAAPDLLAERGLWGPPPPAGTAAAAGGRARSRPILAPREPRFRVVISPRKRGVAVAD